MTHAIKKAVMPAAQIIHLPETAAGRQMMASMDAIMRRTQKTAFSKGQIEKTILTISRMADSGWPLDINTQKPVQTAARLSKKPLLKRAGRYRKIRRKSKMGGRKDAQSRFFNKKKSRRLASNRPVLSRKTTTRQSNLFSRSGQSFPFSEKRKKRFPAVFTLESGTHGDVILLYLCGGAYLYGMCAYHAEFCDALALHTGAKVVLPMYQRIPHHHCAEAMTMLTQLYQEILEEGKPVIFAGDSSGGGLALGFFNHCRRLQLPLPAGLILISPWLDVTLSDKNSDELNKIDMMLDRDGLRICGKIWAGDWDVKDPRVSPLFGDDDDLPEMLLFTGTEELLYHDILKLYEGAKEKTQVTLVVGEGMLHDFPLLAEKTEQKRTALEMIYRFVRRKSECCRHVE